MYSCCGISVRILRHLKTVWACECDFKIECYTMESLYICGYYFVNWVSKLLEHLYLIFSSCRDSWGWCFCCHLVFCPCSSYCNTFHSAYKKPKVWSSSSPILLSCICCVMLNRYFLVCLWFTGADVCCNWCRLLWHWAGVFSTPTDVHIIKYL